MDYRSTQQTNGIEKLPQPIYSNWIEYTPQTMNLSLNSSVQKVMIPPPPPPPPVLPPLIELGSSSMMDSMKFPPLTSPHFTGVGTKKDVVQEQIQQVIENKDCVIESQSKDNKQRLQEIDDDCISAASSAIASAFVSQPDVRYTCQIKPSRRKGTMYAVHGDVPTHLCSAPYKYLLKITHPLNDGLNENDFQVYLTAYDREHQEKGQLEGGLELDYLRSTVNESSEQVHFYHIQFTLTSFLNQNEKYRLNGVIHNNSSNDDDDDEEEEEENKLILQTPEFLLVARKDKKMDDLFWNKYSSINISGGRVISRKKRKKKRKKKKMEQQEKEEEEEEEEDQRRITKTSRKRRKRRSQKRNKKSIFVKQKKKKSKRLTGKKRKREQIDNDDNNDIFSLEKPKKKLRL